MKKSELRKLIKEEIKSLLKEEGNVWYGKVPSKDDFEDPIRDEFIDGKTYMGGWAIMTPKSWMKYRSSKKLGTGSGQRYSKRKNDWVKVDG